MISRLGNCLVPLLILLQLLVEATTENATVTATAKSATVYKYWIFSEQCYHTLLVDRNFANFECVKLVSVPR